MGRAGAISATSVSSRSAELLYAPSELECGFELHSIGRRMLGLRATVAGLAAALAARRATPRRHPPSTVAYGGLKPKRDFLS
jgi:hypothetical protein